MSIADKGFYPFEGIWGDCLECTTPLRADLSSPDIVWRQNDCIFAFNRAQEHEEPCVPRTLAVFYDRISDENEGAIGKRGATLASC